jgi:fumarate reductase subunit C
VLSAEGSVKTKEYQRPMPATWWLHNYHLTLFMLRELTSVFVAGYSIFLMVMLYRHGQGRDAFHAFFQTLRSPASIILQLITLGMVLYHSFTTFNAAPVLMVIRRGEEKVNPDLIIAANYAAWLILSAMLLFAALS